MDALNRAAPWLGNPALAVLGLLLLILCLLWGRGKAQKARAEWERSRRLELEAYCTFDVTLPVSSEPRQLAEQAKRICKVVTEKSCYPRAALYLRDAAGRLTCAGSCGMDDLSLGALEIWSERIMQEEEAETRRDSEDRGRDARKSFSVVLGQRETFDAMPGRGFHRAMIVPMRMSRGRLIGALAVCTDRLVGAKTEQPAEAVAPLELLVGRLAGLVERALVMQRLMEVERLACAGQIVAGVARELKEPLTAVAGLAELMKGTAVEPRVQKDAAMLVEHATKMQTILSGLSGFWRPRDVSEEAAEAAARKEE